MKNIYQKIFSVVFCSFMFAVSSFGQLVADKAEVNLGAINLNERKVCAFSISNRNSTPVTITKISCQGETEATCVPMTIPAGGKAIVNGSVVGNLAGHESKTICIYTDQNKKPLRLVVRYYVNYTPFIHRDKDGNVVEAVVDPIEEATTPEQQVQVVDGYEFGGVTLSAQSIDFGEVHYGDSKIKKVIYLTNNTNESFRPTLAMLPSYIEAVTVPDTIEANGLGQIVVTLNPEGLGTKKQKGLVRTNAYVITKRGDVINDNCAFPMSVISLGRGVSTPAGSAGATISLASTDVQIAQGKSGKVIIKNTGSATLKIENIQALSPELGLNLKAQEIAPGKTTTLSIKFLKDIPAFAIPETAERKVMILSNDTKNPIVTVNVVAK